MAVAIVRGEPLREVLQLAVACDATHAMNEETGFVEWRRVESLLTDIRVKCVAARA